MYSPLLTSYVFEGLCESGVLSHNIGSGPRVMASFKISTKSISTFSMTYKIAKFIKINFKDFHMGIHVEKKITIISVNCVKFDEFSVSSTIIASEPMLLVSFGTSSVVDFASSKKF
jgi:hypothetical protein